MYVASKVVETSYRAHADRMRLAAHNQVDKYGFIHNVSRRAKNLIALVLRQKAKHFSTDGSGFSRPLARRFRKLSITPPQRFSTH